MEIGRGIISYFVELFWGERDLGLNCQLVEYNGEIIRFTADEGTGALLISLLKKLDLGLLILFEGFHCVSS